MLNLLSLICTILAAMCAILSPVLIIGWLLEATGLTFASGFVEALRPFVTPLNGVLGTLLPTPPLTVEGKSFSTAQAVLGGLLTLFFFVFHFLSELCKTMQQKLRVEAEMRRQHNRMVQINRLEKHTKKQINSTDWVFQTRIIYDFAASPSGKELIQNTIRQNHGTILPTSNPAGDPIGLFVEYNNLEHAMSACISMVQNIKKAYARLRPADPQPPLSIGLHGLESRSSTSAFKMAETEKVAGFAGKQQIIFSQAIKEVLDAQQQTTSSYSYVSIGLYVLNDGQQEELYRLELPQTEVGPQLYY